MNYLKTKNKQIKVVDILHRDDEEIVQDGLALKPSEAMDMVNRGIPISNSNLQVLEVYKTSEKDFTVPMEFRRNADISDMWQHRENVRGKVRDSSDRYLNNLSDLKTENNV